VFKPYSKREPKWDIAVPRVTTNPGYGVTALQEVSRHNHFKALFYLSDCNMIFVTHQIISRENSDLHRNSSPKLSVILHVEIKQNEFL